MSDTYVCTRYVILFCGSRVANASKKKMMSHVSFGLCHIPFIFFHVRGAIFLFFTRTRRIRFVTDESRARPRREFRSSNGKAEKRVAHEASLDNRAPRGLFSIYPIATKRSLTDPLSPIVVPTMFHLASSRCVMTFFSYVISQFLCILRKKRRENEKLSPSRDIIRSVFANERCVHFAIFLSCPVAIYFRKLLVRLSPFF